MKKIKCLVCGKDFTEGYNEPMKLTISAEVLLMSHLAKEHKTHNKKL